MRARLELIDGPTGDGLLNLLVTPEDDVEDVALGVWLKEWQKGDHGMAEVSMENLRFAMLKRKRDDEETLAADERRERGE